MKLYVVINISCDCEYNYEPNVGIKMYTYRDAAIDAFEEQRESVVRIYGPEKVTVYEDDRLVIIDETDNEYREMRLEEHDISIDPLTEFINDEVPFRLKEFFDIDNPSEDLINEVHDMMDDTENWVDYDKLDSNILNILNKMEENK